MLSIIQFEGLELGVQAESVSPVEGGYLLTGSPVTLLHPFSEGRFYRHGFHSWSLACWLDLNKPMLPPTLENLWPQLDDPSLFQQYPFTGSGVGAVQGQGEKILLLGALDLDAQVQADGQTLRGIRKPGGPETDARWFVTWGEEGLAFARYASHLGERLGRLGQQQPPRVWCSWYSLFTNISEEVMLSALAGLEGLPFDVFQLDDGWQRAMGDWEANARFPSGMQALAERIAATGRMPGLWLAPLIVQRPASLLNEHPDWLLRDASGQLIPAGHNWGADFYGLDTTHPAVQDWLAALIKKVHSWGFTYLKLDFLYAGAMQAARHQDLRGEEAYRQGLAVMRQAAGDAYILVCGSPVFASLGLADGMRIGPDCAPYWDIPERSEILHDRTGPGTLNALRTSLHRLWLRPLVQVDPDVAYFRQRFNLLQPAEAEYLRQLALITGFRATSDLPFMLDPHERQALLAFLEAQPQVERVGRYRFRVDGQEIDFGFVDRI